MGLTDDDICRIALRIVKYGIDNQFFADQFGVSRLRVQQIAKEYRETGKKVLRKPGPKSKPCRIKEQVWQQGKRQWECNGH
ncbi:MAG: hypothetical protein R6U44_12345 [Archaeoglobaceae archaeon]